MKSILSADKKVCAVVLNWNGGQDTCGCLDSLVRARRVPDTIVVVDNGSTDHSVEQIMNWGHCHFPTVICDDNASSTQRSSEYDLPPPFICLQHSQNRGYGAGNNLGISWALKQGLFDFIWLLNNDTMVSFGSLTALLSCADKSNTSVFGATVVFADQPNVVQCGGGCRYNAWTSMLTPSLAGIALEQVFEVADDDPPLDYIYGASMFVRSTIFDSCGLLSEEYFLFYEELDFCERVKQQGFTLGWCRGAVVSHKVAQSIGRLGKSNVESRVMANYHENLSTLLFSWRFHKSIFPFIFLFRFFGKGIMVALRREWSLFNPLLQAYRDFICQK